MRVPQTTLRVATDTGAPQEVVAPRVAPMQDHTGEQIGMLGQGVAQAGAGVSRVADFLQDEMDDAVSQHVYNSYDEKSRAVANAFRARTGQDAVTAYDSTMQQMLALRKEAEKALQTPRQRQLFAARADSRDIALRSALDGHAADQTRGWKIGALDAGSKNAAIAYASAAPGSEEAAVQRGIALRNAEEALRMQGKGDEEVELAKRMRLDDMHDALLANVTERDARTAQAYLEKYRGEMLPSTVRRAEAGIARTRLEEVSTQFRFQAQEAAASRGGTLAEQQRYAQSIADYSFKGGKLDAEQYERTSAKIRATYMGLRQDQALRTQDALVEAEKFLGEDLTRKVADLPTPVLKAIQDGGALDVINRYANDGRYSTDTEAVANVMGWSRDDHLRMPEAEFAVFAKKIGSPRDQARMQAMRRSLIGDKKSRTEAEGWLSVDQLARNMIRRTFKPDLDAMQGEARSSDRQAIVDTNEELLQEAWVAEVSKNDKLRANSPNDFAKFLKTLDMVEADGKLLPAIFVKPDRKPFATVKWGKTREELRNIPIAIRTDTRTVTDKEVAKGYAIWRSARGEPLPTPEEQRSAWFHVVQNNQKAEKILPPQPEEPAKTREQETFELGRRAMGIR